MCILVVFDRSPYTRGKLTTETGASDGEEKEIISCSLALCPGAWLKSPLMDTLHSVLHPELCAFHSVTGLSLGQGDRELMEDKCVDRLKVSVFHVLSLHESRQGNVLFVLITSDTLGDKRTAGLKTCFGQHLTSM